MDWKVPKSVRQIGDTKGKIKIYVEDYVMAFARRLSKERKGIELGGVLLGRRFYHAREKIFLISGMVTIRDFHLRKSATFSQEMWTEIYTDIKENFTDLDIVGWYFCSENEGKDQMDKLLEIHRRNFAQGDKLLCLYSEKEMENAFLLYENNGFARQKGYYIYYEKNPEMRSYMMEESNRFVHIVEQEDDRVLRNIRGVIREKEGRKKEAEGRWTHGLAAMVIILGLMLAGVAWGNTNGLAELKNQMLGLQSAVLGKKGSKTTVETLGSGVVSGAAIVSGEAANGTEVMLQDPGSADTESVEKEHEGLYTGK